MLHRFVVEASFAVQETALLDGAAADTGVETIIRGPMGLEAGVLSVAEGAGDVAVLWRGGGGQVGNVFWEGMAGSDAGDADIGGFAGFAECVVA